MLYVIGGNIFTVIFYDFIAKSVSAVINIQMPCTMNSNYSAEKNCFLLSMKFYH